MKRTVATIAAALLLALTSVAAHAQSPCQWMKYGYVPTVAQWNSCWQAKQDIAQNGLLTRVGNSDYSVTPQDRAVGTNASFTAARTWTLAPAQNTSAGQTILLTDIFGGVSSGDPLVVAPNVAAGNTINGASSSINLGASFAWIMLISDGISDWTIISIGFGPAICGGDLNSSCTEVIGIGNVVNGVLSASHGGAGAVNGALKANGSGVVSQAACADLSNAAAGCSSTNVPITAIEYVIDGGGSAITTGQKGFLHIPFACTINSATLLADQSGSAVVDVWKVPFGSFPPSSGNSITAADTPTISSAQSAQDTTLTGWTTAINANDVLAFNVNSASTVTRLTLSLKCTKS